VSSSRPPEPWPPSTPEGGLGQPDPDEDDTGPLPISTPSPAVDDTWDDGDRAASLPEVGLPGDARLYTPGDDAWPRHFEPLTVEPRPVGRERRPIILLGAVAAALVVAVGGLAVWQLRSSPSAPDAQGTGPTTSTTPVSPTADPEAQAQLLRLLPAGYPADSCKPVAPPEGALAEVNCARNVDPGGPQASAYTLVRDKAAVDTAFNDIVRASTRVNCPGNIQSPGPWRRNATPHKTSGVLFCGFQQSRPMVAWTDVDDLLVSTVQSGPGGPTFDQLYAWWSSHS
jgi:serine/threonine kinase PknH